MSKGTKKILIVIVVALLVLAIIWAIYEGYKPEPASVNATTELPDENKGIDNIINDFVENETVNETKNVVVNTNKNDSSNESKQEDSNDNSEDNKGSEVVYGTSETREEKAISLAKEYYKDKYGSLDGISFRYDSVYGDGRHIIVASSNGKTVAFLFVNLNTNLVEEK